MVTEIKMPQLGESVTEGTIARWLKAPGDRVKRDEPLVEIVTDKVNAEIPSTVAGVLSEIHTPEGTTVAVGHTIALVETESPVAAAAPHSAPAGDGHPPIDRAEHARRGPRPEAEHDEGEGPSEAAPDALAKRSSPLVRRLAKDHRVDLSQVEGTGLGGRVTKEDILAYVARRDAAHIPDQAITVPSAEMAAAAAPEVPSRLESAAPPVAEPPAAIAPDGVEPGAVPAAGVRPEPGDRVEPVSAVRRTIAQRMVRSHQTIPDAWLMVEADVTGLVRRREGAKEEFRRREGIDLTYLPFIAKAVVESLKDNPIVNSTWAEDRIMMKGQVNLGIAVALDDGLVVPVVHRADERSIAGLARAIADLATRARAGKLSPDDVQGGTFTLNNSGAFGSMASHPIINHPQAAILNMETITRRPVVVGGPDGDAIAVRSMMNLCMAFDHRVMDGAQAGRFIQAVRQRLERIRPDTPIY
ncbi:MAG: 2-oxo acid dehydrogenase subunit E2 [Chloroflexi bacterium]|nr:2-oxo acid dehydrogenase subunit E2 [Chloroflexota bacterium]